MNMQKIGFIGTGVMGTGVIQNLLKAGYPVQVYNRTQAHAETVLKAGATWAATPKALAAANDVVFTMVGYPQDVEQVYFDAATGIFAGAQPGTTLIDMTTSTPSLAVKIGAAGEQRQLAVLDAPVSGGDIGAQKGTLTVMVGGPEAVFTAVQPILKAFGQQIVRFGAYGAGQHTKMANQIMIAGTMTGLTEMLVYAKAAQLDLAAVLKTVGAGAAANWSLSNYGPRILKADYTPGFFAKHFLKDLRIALQEAQRMQLDLPATAQAKQLYTQLVDDQHLGDDGTQALIKLWWGE